jgi:CMP-N-acetylneuraminic acid synthetase
VTKTEAIIENSTAISGPTKKLKHKKLQKQHSQQSNQQEENNGMLYLNNLDLIDCTRTLCKTLKKKYFFHFRIIFWFIFL